MNPCQNNEAAEALGDSVVEFNRADAPAHYTHEGGMLAITG